MKATLKDGSIVEVKTGLDWGVEFDITMLDPDGFSPREPKAVDFNSLMTRDVYLTCIGSCTCKFTAVSMEKMDEIILENNLKG